MPPYLSSYGVSEEIESVVAKECYKVLEDARTKVKRIPNKRLDLDTRLLGTFTHSILHTPSQKNSVKTLESLLSSFRCIRNTEDIASTLGDIVKHRIDGILSIFSAPMTTRSSEIKLCLSTGSLGLPNTAYYLEKSASKLRTLTAYTKLLKKLGEAFDIAGLEGLLGLEVSVAKEHRVSQSDEEVLLKGSELSANYKYIPWSAFAKSAFGLEESDWRAMDILVLTPTWIQKLNLCFQMLSLDQWKLWLSGATLLYFLPILPPPYDDWHFEFFHKRLRDQTEKTPQHRLSLKLSEQWLTASLGNSFIKNYVDETLKHDVIRLAESIRKVAMKRASELDWLEPKTRTYAKEKIDAIHFGVAYPDVPQKQSEVALTPDNPLKNILSLGEVAFQKDLKDANTSLNPKRWDDATFAVNAYYYNEGNRLILPAGILRWPFYHKSASDGWNYGGLGATIGHELTHAFDMDGKDYDVKGNLNPWYTPKDNRAYKEKTKLLETLYSNSEIMGLKINGSLTLSENIADLGGLAIALEALKHHLQTRRVSQEVYKKELCEFFRSYAVSWRTKEKKQKVMQSLFMDLHAPPSVRVNNIVCQFNDWYECFDVQPGDKLYRAPEQRIRIF